MRILERPDQTAAPPEHAEPIGRRNLAVESLRGVAALGVVGYHLSKVIEWRSHGPLRTVLANGDAGVTLFFVLSGFLLWRPFAAASLDGERFPSVRQFARNRALRILPAYWVALTLVMLFVSGSRPAGAAPWPFYLFAQNYSRGAHLGVIAPAWSLAVEAVFYVALPVFGLLVFHLSRRAATRADRYRLQLWLIAAWFGLGLADKLYWMVVRHAPARDVFTYFQFLPKAHLFAFGMLLALWHAHDRTTSPLRGSPPWLAPVLGFGIVAAASVAREATFTTAVMFDTATALGFFLVVSAVAFDGDGHTRLSRALHWRPLVWIGVVSYSLYLLHERILRLMVRRGLISSSPAFAIADLIAVVAVSLVAAWLLYRFVEKPFLSLRKRWS